ncbi:MAG: RHS repeat domain-containing protein [Myxococcota bacterium]
MHNTVRWSGMVACCTVSALAAEASAQSYQYDAQGRLSRVDYADGSSIEYTLDASGNITAVQSTPPPANNDNTNNDNTNNDNTNNENTNDNTSNTNDNSTNSNDGNPGTGGGGSTPPAPNDDDSGCQATPGAPWLLAGALLLRRRRSLRAPES